MVVVFALGYRPPHHPTLPGELGRGGYYPPAAQRTQDLVNLSSTESAFLSRLLNVLVLNLLLRLLLLLLRLLLRLLLLLELRMMHQLSSVQPPPPAQVSFCFD